LRVYIGESADAHNTKPGERAPSALLFFSEAPMSLINYADNLEEEGTFGDTAKTAWENALEEWLRYANRDLNTSYGYTVRLGDFEEFQRRISELEQHLEKRLPGEKEKIHQTKLNSLTADERRALEKNPIQRSPEEANAANSAEGKTKVTWEEVILQAPAAERTDLRRLNDELVELKHKVNTIDTYRDIVNYDYWWTRCQAEPTDTCLTARELLYQAGQAYKETKLFDAKKLYEDAFAKWRTVLDQYSVLRSSTIMADELVDEINKYKKVLGKIPGSKFPEKFVLQDMIDVNDGKPITIGNSPKATEPAPPAKNKGATKNNAKNAA
jgi:hypothetical protein